jgi:hypothetical protein
MRTALYLMLMLASSMKIFAGDNITPLNVKEGLWEVTNTRSMSGITGTRNIPPDVLAKMPADQRAKIEAMMSGKPTTDVRRSASRKKNWKRIWLSAVVEEIARVTLSLRRAANWN